MIVCPVCHTENSHLATTCKECRSFVQTKIDTLDLFATVWLLLESPRKAFHRISIARHKNYVIFLSFIHGIAILFFVMWLVRIGDMDVSLPQILGAGFVLGPVLGLIMLLLFAAVQKFIAKTLRLTTRFMNAVAIISYAMIPIALSVIFILPVEILTFGKLFFSTNPSPYLLKPTSYVALLMLDGTTILWSFVLYIYGVRALYDLGVRKALLVSSLTVGVCSALLFSGVSGISTKLSKVAPDKKVRVTVSVMSHENLLRR